MEKKYLSDFGFVISDEEKLFEKVNQVSEYDVNNDLESATVTNSFVDEILESNQSNSEKTLSPTSQFDSFLSIF